jgi:hypothetical protein
MVMRNNSFSLSWFVAWLVVFSILAVWWPSAEHAQSRDTEIRALAETFAKEIAPPPVEVYVEFAKEVAAVQRERDAALAEKLGANYSTTGARSRYGTRCIDSIARSADTNFTVSRIRH